MARGMGDTGVWTEKFRRRSMELAHGQESEALQYNHNVFHDTTKAFTTTPINGMMIHPAHVHHAQKIAAKQGQTDLDSVNDADLVTTKSAPPAPAPDAVAIQRIGSQASEGIRNLVGEGRIQLQASPLLEADGYDNDRTDPELVKHASPTPSDKATTLREIDRMKAEIAQRLGAETPTDWSSVAHHGRETPDVGGAGADEEAAAAAELASASNAGKVLPEHMQGARYPDSATNSPAFPGNDTDTDPGYETPNSAAHRGDGEQIENKAVIRLHKGSVGLGVNFHGVGSEETGDLKILIKGIHPKMTAGVDGRLQVNDRIISVDGRSLLGKSKAEAVQLLSFTKDIVVFEIEATAERVKALEAIERSQRAAALAAAEKAAGGASAKPTSASDAAANRAAAASAARQQSVLEKRVVLSRPNTQHSFGFSIESTDSGTHKVAAINENGIAANADVRVGDVIAHVSGMATTGLNHDQLTMLCAKAALSLEIVIKRTPKPFTEAPRARAPPAAAESSGIADELQRAAAAHGSRPQNLRQGAAAETRLVQHTFVLKRQTPNTGFGFSIGAAKAGCEIGGVNMPEGTHFCLKVNYGSPAEGNLRPDDILLAIDGVDVRNASHDDTVDLVKNAGASMALSVLRATSPGTPNPIKEIVDNGLSKEVSNSFAPSSLPPFPPLSPTVPPPSASMCFEHGLCMCADPRAHSNMLMTSSAPCTVE